MRRDTSLLDPKHGLWWQNQNSRMQLYICYWKQHMITATGFLIACPSGKYRYNYLKVKSHPQLPMSPMCKTQWAHNINRGLFTMFLAQTSLSTIAQWNIFALSLSPEYVFLINLNAYPKITLLNKHYSHSCDLKSKGCYLGTFPFRIAMNHTILGLRDRKVFMNSIQQVALTSKATEGFPAGQWNLCSRKISSFHSVNSRQMPSE